MLALLLAAAAPGAVDAERAFAADARTIGQWSAFRKWAAEDATMFTPQPVKAQDWLRDRKDPAKAIDWWPTASYVSCDGTLAVNTGGWKASDGGVGYFSTVWRKQAGSGWKWTVDGGDDLPKARAEPAIPAVTVASCRGKALPVEQARSLQDDGSSEIGQSADRTLWWKWEVGARGDRLFSAYVWNGASFREILHDVIAAPK